MDILDSELRMVMRQAGHAYATSATVADLKMGPSWAIIYASGHRPVVWPGRVR